MTVEAIAATTAKQTMVVNVGTEFGTNLVSNADPNHAFSSFGQVVSQGIMEVNQDLLVSQTDLQQLAMGNVQNLHQIMIHLEESRLSFQLFMQVRNRLLEAYQDIMKMQV